MEVRENFSLKPYNTFQIDVESRRFVEIDAVDKLKKVIETQEGPLLILGGGSNILFTKDFEGVVLKNEIKGIERIDENSNTVVYKVGAGVVWHDFVRFSIDHNLGGLENLSLIPGNVGASPMQNIGAYGVEVKELIVEVETFDMKRYKKVVFSNSQCEFGYRTSIFKTREKGNYFITSVTFRLSKQPKLNTSYGAIEEELKQMGVNNPSIRDVSEAVINIRSRKLPDPNKIGNSGSFFKNPVISEEKKNEILEKNKDLPFYPQGDEKFKVAAGWLIEKCGWKGFRENNYGVHKDQALVLVNYGGARGEEIYELSERILDSVETTFGIRLEREVNIV